MNSYLRHIKKYYIQLLLIIATPLIINTLMVQPMLFPITGDSSSWLGFWGSYIGAVLSSAIALYILYKQNHYCPRNSFNISKSNKLIVTHQN